MFNWEYFWITMCKTMPCFLIPNSSCIFHHTPLSRSACRIYGYKNKIKNKLMSKKFQINNINKSAYMYLQFCLKHNIYFPCVYIQVISIHQDIRRRNT